MLVMFKYLSFKFLFILGISPLCLLFISGCNNKEIEANQNLDNNELVDRIDSVAALGQLNPLGEVRKLAAPNSGKGGTPRLSKLLIGEGDSVHKEQILAVFDNRPKLEANFLTSPRGFN